MIISRAFYREAGFTTIATIIVLTALFLVQGAAVLLAQTAEDTQQRGVLLNLLLLNTLKDYGVLLLLALFLGVLITVSRWYRDSEMAVLAACGVGTLQLLGPVMRYAFVAAVVIAIQALYIRPLVFAAIDRVQHESVQRQGIHWITEGTFNTGRGWGGVIYSEKIDKDGVMHDVFINERLQKEGVERTTTARTARQITDVSSGQDFLRLDNGILYEGAAGMPQYRVIQFDSYWLRTPKPASGRTRENIEAVSSHTLLVNSNRNQLAEWQARIAKPIMAFILAAIALSLSYTDPRRGRYVNLFISVMVFFLYSNMVGIGKTLLREGRVPEVVGLWWVHLLFAAIAVYFLYRRNKGQPLWVWPLVRRRQI